MESWPQICTGGYPWKACRKPSEESNSARPSRAAPPSAFPPRAPLPPPGEAAAPCRRACGRRSLRAARRLSRPLMCAWRPRVTAQVDLSGAGRSCVDCAVPTPYHKHPGRSGAYECVPWSKVGGRRAQAAPPTLAPNNGAGDVAVHESDEPMTINMTEHGCSIDGTITMKNSVRLLSVSLRTPAGFAPLSAVLCCISVGHTCGVCPVFSVCGPDAGREQVFMTVVWCRLLRSAAYRSSRLCEVGAAVRTSRRAAA